MSVFSYKPLVFHKRLARASIVVAAAWAFSGIALAAPDAASNDAVNAFLIENGWVDGKPAAPSSPPAPNGSGPNAMTTATGAPSPAGAANGDAPSTPTRFVDSVRDTASDMVMTAMNFLGVPYRRGGTSADHGFDCSGFTRHVFEMSLGLVLPHRADDQARAPGFMEVKVSELRPGDLVFFNTLRRTFSHVGIYVGEGKFIHAPSAGSGVRVEDMRYVYWARRFTGARRVESAARLGNAAVRALN